MRVAGGELREGENCVEMESNIIDKATLESIVMLYLSCNACLLLFNLSSFLGKLFSYLYFCFHVISLDKTSSEQEA